VIDIEQVLTLIPKFETFCSVDKLLTLLESLRHESRHMRVDVEGTSVNGVPIYHVKCGTGSVKALIVGFPHPNEPIGGLTVFSLLTLLGQGNRQLVEANVEWHVVPCIDPDGAILNEGWSQKAFTLGTYMRNVHRPELRDQVECSFPIRHKRLIFNQPVHEARILQGLLERIQPDFYFSLHNNPGTGGAWYLLSHDIGERYYAALRTLLKQHHISLKTNPPFGDFCAQFSPGIKEPTHIAKYYDFLEKTVPCPEEVLGGACSWEHLAKIKSDAVTFVAELPYLRHPSDASDRPTGQNLRQLKLRVDSDNKFLSTVILETWQKVREDLDTRSPFYRKILHGIISAKDKLYEGVRSWPYKTRDVLLNPAYNKTMSEGERFYVYLWDRFVVLCNSYEFVRLLKESTQSDRVRDAVLQLEAIFDDALDDIAKNVNLSEFQLIDCDSLARVQLGSGLIVLNALLEKQATTRVRDLGP
jgi:hypothetical protein